MIALQNIEDKLDRDLNFELGNYKKICQPSYNFYLDRLNISMLNFLRRNNFRFDCLLI